MLSLDLKIFETILCIPGCPQTHSVAEDDLEPPASALQMLKLQLWSIVSFLVIKYADQKQFR